MTVSRSKSSHAFKRGKKGGMEKVAFKGALFPHWRLTIIQKSFLMQVHKYRKDVFVKKEGLK